MQMPDGKNQNSYTGPVTICHSDSHIHYHPDRYFTFTYSSVLNISTLLAFTPFKGTVIHTQLSVSSQVKSFTRIGIFASRLELCHQSCIRKSQ